jgi:hypothetical protein
VRPATVKYVVAVHRAALMLTQRHTEWWRRRDHLTVVRRFAAEGS